MAQVEVNQNERIYREKNIYVYCERPFNLKILYENRPIKKPQAIKALEWAKYIIVNDYLEEGQWGMWEALQEGTTSFSLTLFPSSDLLEEEIEVSNLSHYWGKPLIEVRIEVSEDDIFEARIRALQMINKFLSLLK
ncbi:MAG: hypothetical protein QXX23_07345 [Thermoplasmata archaeon]